MLDNIALKGPGAEGGSIKVDRSRCLRLRAKGARCSICRDCCPPGAINYEAGLSLNEQACTGCMLCTSSCPTDALEPVDIDFYDTISALRILKAPVLGCRFVEDGRANIKGHCLGYLSEPHLIALLAFLEGAVQLNLSGCAGCVNSSITDTLKKRLKTLSGNLSLNLERKILLVTRDPELQYEEPPSDRRGFFKALRGFTLKGASGLIEGMGKRPAGGRSFAKKALTIKRKLLNRAFSPGPEPVKQRMLEHYYYSLWFEEGCSDCLACVGACPTGAIMLRRNETGNSLMFSTALCTGCGLCLDFCPVKVIMLKKGAGGDLKPTPLRTGLEPL